MLGGVLVYSNTATGGVVASTNVETAFTGFSYSIAANSVLVGDVFEVELRGKWGSKASGPGTLNLQVKIGATVVIAMGAVTVTASMTNRGWRSKVRFTVSAIGAAGSIIAEGDAQYYNGTPVDNLCLVPTGGTVSSIDFTAALALTATATWSVSDSANTITLEQVTVCKLTAAVSNNTEGAAFPTTGLYTGRKFYRTDLFLDCFYDGTRWLGPEFPVTLTLNGASTTFTATGALAYGVARQDYQLYATTGHFHINVTGTNNASNYWTMEFGTRDSAAASTGLTPTSDTSTLTSGTGYSRKVTINALVPTSAVYFYFQAKTKTGSAGSANVVGPVIFVRPVIP